MEFSAEPKLVFFPPYLDLKVINLKAESLYHKALIAKVEVPFYKNQWKFGKNLPGFYFVYIEKNLYI